MKYKDIQNKVHDIDPAFVHLLPIGCVEITDEDAQAIQDALIAAQPKAIPSMTPKQVRLILTASGLRSQVEAAVAASDQDTKDMWEFSSVFLRDDPVLVAMAAGLGMTDIQLDDLFIQGSKL